MTLIAVSSMCFSLLFLMPSMSQPLGLGLCVMILSLLFCIMIGLTVSSWYGYVLFLVYVGGLLVMFAYVSALIPNNYFSSLKPALLFVFGSLGIPAGAWSVYFSDHKVLCWYVDFFGEKFMYYSGVSLAGPGSVCMMVLLGIVLLINLLAVVKVCYYQQGPLRPYSELK